LLVRESVRDKGRRYLVEGRLIVRSVDAGYVVATCRGGGEEYRLGHNTSGWWCPCPARGLCAHLVALQLVVDRADRGAS
jgi:hypothetical protein